MTSTLTLTLTPAAVEAECRAFAAEFGGPNVQRAIRLCEAGDLEWALVHELFTRSLTAGLAAVR